MVGFIDIPPLSKEITRYAKKSVKGRTTDERTAGGTTGKHNTSAAYFWRRHKITKRACIDSKHEHGIYLLSVT